jgi:transcriptional regulator with XRE-family HTH domain
MSARKILALNLKRLRQELGLSQEALADAAGLDRTYISSLEREKYAATIDTLENLAKVLKVEPAHLLMINTPTPA